MLYSKLGTGTVKYKIRFVYIDTNRSAIKYVYADNLEEAKDIFNNYYKGYKVKIKEIKESQVIEMNNITTDNVSINFEIVSTDNPDKSILNTIVLLLADLTSQIEREYKDEQYTKLVNDNIDKIQRELENLKYKEV